MACKQTMLAVPFWKVVLALKQEEEILSQQLL